MNFSEQFSEKEIQQIRDYIKHRYKNLKTGFLCIIVVGVISIILLVMSYLKGGMPLEVAGQLYEESVGHEIGVHRLRANLDFFWPGLLFLGYTLIGLFIGIISIKSYKLNFKCFTILLSMIENNKI